MRDVRDFGVELVPGEGLTYHTRENLDTYFWYAWDTSHASDAKKPCFSYPLIHRKRDFSLTPVVQVAVGHQAMTTHCTFMASRGARPSLEGQQQPDAKKL